jgi:hypothetical protein
MKTLLAEVIDSTHLLLKEPLPEGADEIVVKIKLSPSAKKISEGAKRLLASLEKGYNLGKVHDISREAIYEDVD